MMIHWRLQNVCNSGIYRYSDQCHYKVVHYKAGISDSLQRFCDLRYLPSPHHPFLPTHLSFTSLTVLTLNLSAHLYDQINTSNHRSNTIVRLNVHYEHWFDDDFTLFLAMAVSLSALAHAPAWPNWTSEVNILAQVPIHHATTGLNRRPLLMASHMEYSSIPPT